jgi:hypothetical protein
LGTPGAANRLGQRRVNFIQQVALGGAFGQGLFQDTGFAGAFYQISDFKIVFIFKIFLNHIYIRRCHSGKGNPLNITGFIIPQVQT